MLHAYNRLGELVWKKDQNQDVHAYTRDGVGRVTADVATIDGGSPADDWIDAITTTYDGFGRRESVQSRDGGASGAIKNAVEFTYTPLWQIQDVWQDHDSAVNTGGGGSNSRKVTSTYTSSAQAGTTTNFSRLTKLTYPDGSEFEYAYDGFKRVSQISRVSGFLSVALVNYSYVGSGVAAVVDYEQPDIRLDHTVAHNGARTSGEYPGFDRYGRIVRQHWADGNLTTHATDGAVPNIPPIVELGYGYDNHGNRTHMFDERPGAKRGNRDWSYSYDGLDRLVEARRGISGGGGSWTFSPGSERWTLDMLGNWDEFESDDDGDGSFVDPYELELRAHNFTNEIESQVRDDDPTDLPVSDPPLANQWSATGAAMALCQLDEPSVYVNYVHDAWGRLVSVSYDADLRAEYEYNGLGWRTVKRADAQAVPDGTLTQQRVMYYDASWRLLEERIDDDLDTDPGDDRAAQQLWGVRYIDDAVMRRIDANLDFDYSDGGDGTWWYVTDAMFSVVAVVDNAATLVERVGYTPYGVARHQWPADVDGDGAVTTGGGSDLSLANAALNELIDDAGYNVDADIDRDGDVDTNDTAHITAKAALTKGSLSSEPHQSVGMNGYLMDNAAMLYTVRRRHFAPSVGRWLQRDPLLTAMPQYIYCSASPMVATDPTGLIDTWHECRRRCGSWADREARNLSWLLLLPDCPCNLGPSGTDPTLPEPDLWYEEGHTSFHDGNYCIRSRPLTIPGPGQQCCYDANNNLVTHGQGAGTPDRWAPIGIIGTGLHFIHDVAPYDNCIWEGGLLDYHRARPPNQGRDATGAPCPPNP